MDRTSGGAPLLSLDAVVIDTETTGLDPRKARVIELAGVRLSAGKLVAGESFRQLLRPAGQSIPAETTRIHGIDDAMVAGSPLFADVWPRFTAFLGQAPGDRALGRLRPCGAEARMRSRRPAVDTATHARHAAAGADRRTGTGRLFAGGTRRMARCRRRRPAFRARRRHNGGAGVSGAGAEAARPRHPHHCRGRTGLPRPHLRTRRSGAERLDRGRRSSGTRRCGTNPETLRQLRLSASQSRHHADASGLCGGRHFGPRRRSRGLRAKEYRLSIVAPARSSRRRQGGGGGHCHGTRRAARDRPVRRRRARFAGRADHEPAAGCGSRGRLRLSRDRPHEPSQDPPPRRRRRGRPRGRRIVRA